MASSSTAINVPPTASTSKNNERELKIRAKFEKIPPYAHANTPSTVTEEDAKTIRSEYQFTGEYIVRAPTADERMYWRPSIPSVAVPTQILKHGIRFPLHPFISDFLDYVGIGIAQLVPNAYIHIVCFIAACKKFGIQPAMDYFLQIFSLTKTKEHGFRSLSKLPGQRAWMTLPSSNKGWHNNWVYVVGPDTHLIQQWGDPERPLIDPPTGERRSELKNFCKAIPKEPWDIRWLTNQQWLYDHGCK